MDYKSNAQKIDPYRYVSQNKGPQIYEPVLKPKDDKISKPMNGNPNLNFNKNISNYTSNTQKDVDEYELAQAQKSLKLLKSKMNATPKQLVNTNFENYEEEPNNFKAFNNKSNQNSEKDIYVQNQNNDDFGAQNKNYRKVFKPPL